MGMHLTWLRRVGAPGPQRRGCGAPSGRRRWRPLFLIIGPPFLRHLRADYARKELFLLGGSSRVTFRPVPLVFVPISHVISVEYRWNCADQQSEYYSPFPIQSRAWFDKFHKECW